MTALASTDQVRALQATRRRAGIADDDWRAKLRVVSGQESTKGLTYGQAGALLDELRQQVPASERHPSPDQNRLAGPYGAKARALWISAWHLGLTADNTDKALLAFVLRQTGLKSLSWVRDAGHGRAVVEALKAWIAREGLISWTRFENPKEAVVVSLLSLVQQRRFVDSITPIFKEVAEKTGISVVMEAHQWTDAELDKAAKFLGAMLRKLKGK